MDGELVHEFLRNVGEAMSMTDSRCVIDMDTLEVEVYPGNQYFSTEVESCPPPPDRSNPSRYFAVENVSSQEAFDVLEAFANQLEAGALKKQLTEALRSSRPFCQFKKNVDCSNYRSEWRDFKEAAYTEIASDWILHNAPAILKKKLLHLQNECSTS